MTYFNDIYLKRLNRFGHNYKTRVQSAREKSFNDYLNRSVYKISTRCNFQSIVGSFEKYKQNESEALHYLLTNTDVLLPLGAVLEIENVNHIKEKWMVYYLEDMQASGYNRYIMLRLDKSITWIDENGTSHLLDGYIKGRGDTALNIWEHNIDIHYAENDTKFVAILTNSNNLKIGDYFISGEDNFKIVGFDRQTTPGIIYVSLDPIYQLDLSPIPEPNLNDKDEEVFWLNGLS